MTENEFWKDLGYNREEIEDGDTEETRVFKVSATWPAISTMIQAYLYVEGFADGSIEFIKAQDLLYNLHLEAEEWRQILTHHHSIYYGRVGNEEWFAVVP